MRQFRKIFRFETVNLLTKKVYIGVTLFLIAVIVCVTFFPRVAALFADDEEEQSGTAEALLVAGVPEGGGFGRVGADVGLCWENKAFSREDVSTQNTLTNTIFRRHLDGRAFLNDPDVFLLRDNNIKMPLSKRKIIAQVNSLCGNLLFVSDDVSTYTDEQKQIFSDTITKPKAVINNAEFIKDKIIKIDYSVNGKNESLTFDLSTGLKI